MKRFLNHITALCLLCLSVTGSMAQQLTVRAPESVSVGQRFQVSFTANAKADNFQGPTFKGFSVLSGPHTSYSSSMSFINGKRSSSVEYSFQYVVSADQEGSFQVGAATCTIEGKKVSSQPFTIKVTKGQNHQQSSPNRATQPNNSQSSSTQNGNISPESLYAKASVNKGNPYQGEQIIVTYKIYTQVSLQNFQLDKLPGNKGFWSEDLSEGKQIKSYDETIDGRQYRVAEIRRGAMFAQESGKLSIEPLEMDVLALIPRQRRRTGSIFDLFDDPFFNPTQAVERHLRTNAFTVQVKPLPPAPEGFAGGVGSLSVKAETDQTHVRANEAITYRITVSGSGNLPLLQAPDIAFPQVFDVYEPKVIDNISRSDGGISGSRTFEWVLIPQSQGNYEIPALHYVYFNPATGHYETLTREAISIQVDKGDAANKVIAGDSRNDVLLLNHDINHIKTRTHLRTSDGGTGRYLPQLLTAILIILLSAIAILIGRRRQAQQADEKGMRLRHATKLARKRLRTAEKYLNSGDDNKFYEEIYKALWGCISDKYGIDLSQLSRDTVEQKLQEKQVSPEVQSRILRTLEAVDYARFAPGNASATKQHIYQEAIQTIVVL